MNRTKRGINLLFSILFLLSASLAVTSVNGYDFSAKAANANSDQNQKTTEADEPFHIIYQTAKKSGEPKRKYLSIGGTPFGIKLYASGVVVVGSESILTKDGYVSPSELAGLRTGDIITHADQTPVTRNSELSAYLAGCGGKNVTLTVIRNNEEMLLTFTPVLSADDNRYKAGLWVRDSSAGIGTMSFYDDELGMFCGLGHGVSDVDTGELVPLLEGEAVGADISGAYKGAEGVIGELIGSLNENMIGDIIENSAIGVYGYCENSAVHTGALYYPLAAKDEVKTGKAQIITTVDDGGQQVYDIEITKIDRGTDEKNLIISVTDASLIAKTGGIVQGMSGSPIIQNGALVGVVTHVFIDNPKGGYGIFAETMYNEMRQLNENKLKDAA